MTDDDRTTVASLAAENHGGRPEDYDVLTLQGGPNLLRDYGISDDGRARVFELVGVRRSASALTCGCGLPDCRTADKWTAGTFVLANMPGCCGVTVLTGLDATVERRGLGAVLLREATATAKEYGYSYLLGTEITYHRPTMKLLRRAGWDKLAIFNNKNTGNDVGVFGIDLRNPPNGSKRWSVGGGGNGSTW